MEQELSSLAATLNRPETQSNDKMGQANWKVVDHSGNSEPFDLAKIERTFNWASQSYGALITIPLLIDECLKNMFDGIKKSEISEALILSSLGFIEKDPVYSGVAARLLFKKLYKEITHSSAQVATSEQYALSFIQGIQKGIAYGSLDERLGEFDLGKLSAALRLERDLLFDYMGLRTLYERYFFKFEKTRLELPQAFWMRIAMGLCYNEPNKNEKAIEFYETLSAMEYVPGTPTLLHAGFKRAQLSSCFLTTVSDDLGHIFKCVGDNAQLSKWSGGVANDWTPLRATGASIKSINTESQGVIPFLKIVNDVTAAINRSGSRRAATCVYLETWHLDIEDFLDLRRNTGDERRRAHDISTANWIPDLFMKRVIAKADWTLFSPDEVPELHDLYGKAFEIKYLAYEQLAREGKIALFKVVPAEQIWRKMLSRLFETGHPWLTWKDAFNIRSPQDHDGVIHSTNLCTEISLNTSKEETAVCNLGSINLPKFIENGKLNDDKLAQTVRSAMRMLDNVIDISFYVTPEARNANQKHRPVGLGLMGFQDALYELDIPFSDPRARDFADEIMEKIAYMAILSSSELAKERGAYASYKGSKWDRNLFPQDTIALHEKERGVAIPVSRTEKLDWTRVREHVKTHGMRNSNTMAIAPTATISTIAGCFPCIEPIYKNIYVKANMNGEFTVINKYLVEDLKKHGLWNSGTLDQIKYHDGSLSAINWLPQSIRTKYQDVFEIDPLWLIEISAYRGRWIDQSQSHNVFMKGVSGKMLNDIYLKAWEYGLKSTYYLRTLGASQIEKSTLDAKEFGYTQKREYTQTKPSETENLPETAAACNLSTDPSCEVCQ